MSSPTFFNIVPMAMALIAIAVSIGFALDASDNPQVQANKDNITILFDFKDGQVILNQEVLNKAGNNTADIVLVNQTAEANKVTGKANKDEITATKLDIKNKFPKASDVENTGSSVISNTPFLTLAIDKTSYIPGETITFTGTANPGQTVFVNVQKFGGCGRDDVCSAWAKVDVNGNFEILFYTEFDDPEGAWKAYAKEGADNRSQTIVFEVAN